jgi:hypothetical protein
MVATMSRAPWSLSVKSSSNTARVVAPLRTTRERERAGNLAGAHQVTSTENTVKSACGKAHVRRSIAAPLQVNDARPSELAVPRPRIGKHEPRVWTPWQPGHATVGDSRGAGGGRARDSRLATRARCACHPGLGLDSL